MENQNETGKNLKLTIETDGTVTKVYVNDKQIEKGCFLEVKAEPGAIKIEIEKHVTDENGKILLNEDETDTLKERLVLIDSYKS